MTDTRQLQQVGLLLDFYYNKAGASERIKPHFLYRDSWASGTETQDSVIGNKKKRILQALTS